MDRLTLKHNIKLLKNPFYTLLGILGIAKIPFIFLFSYLFPMLSMIGVSYSDYNIVLGSLGVFLFYHLPVGLIGLFFLCLIRKPLFRAISKTFYLSARQCGVKFVLLQKSKQDVNKIIKLFLKLFIPIILIFPFFNSTFFCLICLTDPSMPLSAIPSFFILILGPVAYVYYFIYYISYVLISCQRFLYEENFEIKRIKNIYKEYGLEDVKKFTKKFLELTGIKYSVLLPLSFVLMVLIPIIPAFIRDSAIVQNTVATICTFCVIFLLVFIARCYTQFLPYAITTSSEIYFNDKKN